MALEDFEKQLAEERAERDTSQSHKRKRSKSPSHRREHRHRRHHHHHHSHGHRSRRPDEAEEDRSHDKHHRHQSSRNDGQDNKRSSRHRRDLDRSPSNSEIPDGTALVPDGSATDILRARERENEERPQRMSWMEAPSTDVEHIRSRRPKTPPGYFRKAADTNKRPPEPAQEEEEEPVKHGSDVSDIPGQHEVDYKIGDGGSEWRMKKLRGVYREAKESGRPVEEIAIQRYGDLRTFDDAREEETEMDRRNMYGDDYVGKEKPSGDLYEERKLKAGLQRQKTEGDESSEDEFETAQAQTMKEKSPPAQTLALDQNTLGRLKKASDGNAEGHTASAKAVDTKEPEVVVLNKMESRMFTGGRQGEVSAIDNKRGRERGLVEENEDMTIEDMVRQERRTKGQRGGDGRAFAERIAKDGKFDNDLDYLDDNATKLAKSVQQSDLNLRNTAISEYRKMKRILDSCPLCTHEDTGAPPQAPVVSLATRTYLTLPTSPEITPYGCCASIVPVQHRLNLLECDDDEWEEMRNFMKSLTRFYYSLKPKRSVIFYENAAHAGRKRHASMEAVPLPISIAENISQYFREAILSADEEWTQHKKVIDTLKKSEEVGKNAFRKSMVSELPYFHAWFRLDGGLGHVVEDSRRWPKGDLFAREIIGGVLNVAPETIRNQGRWRRDDEEMSERVTSFRGKWEPWDWTKVLMEPQ